MIRIKRKNIGRIAFVLICLGLFATPFIWRNVLLPSDLGLFNPLAWLGIFLIMIRYYQRGMVLLAKPGQTGSSNPAWILLLIGIFLLATAGSLSIKKMVLYVYATLCPLFFLYVTVPDEEVVEYVKIFSVTLTIVCTIIVCCGLVDRVSGNAVSRAITHFINSDSLKDMLKEKRMVSYMGHPLQTAELMLLCFLFNTLWNYYLKEKESFLYVLYYSLISVAGIGMCGGKSGIVLIAVSFAVLFANRKGAKYILFVSAAVYGVIQAGFLDTVIKRILRSFSSGDLTTGRYSSLMSLLRRNALPIDFISSHAGDSMSTIMIAALENPLLRWAYQFGVWLAVIMCLYLFVPPLIRALKARNIYILTAMMVLILDVNTYNGLATLSDLMLLYCVAMFLLLNLTRVLENAGYEAMRNRTKPLYIGRSPEGSHNDTQPIGREGRL